MTAKKKPAKRVSTKRVKAGTSKAAAAARRALFVEAYLSNNGNATQAYKAAGFTAKNSAVAGVEGGKLLKDPWVAAEIARRRELIQRAAEVTTGLTLERTLREVARLAYSDPRKFYKADGSLIPVLELDEDTAATVASVEVDEINADGAVIGRTKKLKVWDKNSALEKAMKYHGLYEKDNRQKADPVLALLAAIETRDAGFEVKR